MLALGAFFVTEKQRVTTFTFFGFTLIRTWNEFWGGNLLCAAHRDHAIVISFAAFGRTVTLFCRQIISPIFQVPQIQLTDTFPVVADKFIFC